MKKDRTQWIASMVCGFALGLFLVACESKDKETPAQAPGEGSQSMAPPAPEPRQGMMPSTPEEQAGPAEKEKQQRPMG